MAEKMTNKKEKEEKTVRELRSLAKKAIDFRRRNKDDEYLKCMAHWEGIHWNLTSTDEANPFLIKSDINHLKAAGNIRLASLYAKDYKGELIPKSPEDIEIVDNLQILYNAEWERLKLNSKIKEVLKYSFITGECYLYFNYDGDTISGGTGAKNEGGATVKVVYPQNVYIDPSATSFETADYIVLVNRKSKNWVKRNKKEWYEKLKKLNKEGTVSSQGQEDGEFFEGRDYSTEQDNLYSLKTIMRKETVDTKKGSNFVIKTYYLLNDELVETHSNYPFDFFPIIQLPWEDMLQSPYNIPALRGVMTPQKVVNIIESALNNLAVHYTIPSYLLHVESGIDGAEFAKISGAAGMVYETNIDVDKSLKAVRPPQIDNQLLGVKDSFISNIQTHLGVTPQYVGVLGTAGNTVQGADSAIGRATIVDTLPIDQLETFVEKITRILLAFTVRYQAGKPFYYREEVEAKGNPKIKNYSFNEFTIEEEADSIPFDFINDLAVKTTNDRERQYQILSQLYQQQIQYKDSDKIVNVSDVAREASLDQYPVLFERYQNMKEETIAEKTQTILEIIAMGNVTTPNGEPLIPVNTLMEAVSAIINDKQDLSIVQEIQETYEQYQEQVMLMEQEMQAQQTGPQDMGPPMM